MPIERQKEVRRRRHRRRRLKKLKAALAEAKTIEEKERLNDLIRRRESFYEPPKK